MGFEIISEVVPYWVNIEDLPVCS